MIDILFLLLLWSNGEMWPALERRGELRSRRPFSIERFLSRAETETRNVRKLRRQGLSRRWLLKSWSCGGVTGFICDEAVG